MEIILLPTTEGPPETYVEDEIIHEFLRAYKSSVFGHGCGIKDDKNMQAFIDSIKYRSMDKMFVDAKGGIPVCIGAWKRQDWESEQLGVGVCELEAYAIGREDVMCDQYKKVITLIVDDAKKSNVDLIHSRVPLSDYSLIHAMQYCGFITMDVVVNYVWKPPWSDSQKKKATSWEIREFMQSDLEPMKILSEQSFTDRRFIKTRYTTDGRISNSNAAKLYGAWLLESARGNFADNILIAEEDGIPIGFIACKIQEFPLNDKVFRLGSITLNAVAENKRGKGVYSSLLEASLEWFQSRAEAVTLCSQLTNTGVHRACINLGANLDTSHVTFHKWI